MILWTVRQIFKLIYLEKPFSFHKSMISFCALSPAFGAFQTSLAGSVFSAPRSEIPFSDEWEISSMLVDADIWSCTLHNFRQCANNKIELSRRSRRSYLHLTGFPHCTHHQVAEFVQVILFVITSQKWETVQFCK